MTDTDTTRAAGRTRTGTVTCTGNPKDACGSTPLLEQLPVELVKRISSYLGYHDVLRLSHANRNLLEVLRMSIIRMPSPLFSCTPWHGDMRTGDDPQPCSTLPILLKNRVHTVVLQGYWKDQGSGNRKGKLYVVATSTLDANQAKRTRLVLTSPLAPHARARFSLEFNVHEDERYALWYSVGSGLGHILHVSEVYVKLCLYDIESHLLSRNFHAMTSRGALQNGAENSFHLRMVQLVAQTLTQQMEKAELPDINMASFLESTGIEMSLPSMFALDQIVSSLLQERQTHSNALPSQQEVDAIRQQLFPVHRVDAAAAHIASAAAGVAPQDNDSDESMEARVNRVDIDQAQQEAMDMMEAQDDISDDEGNDLMVARG